MGGGRREWGDLIIGLGNWVNGRLSISPSLSLSFFTKRQLLSLVLFRSPIGCLCIFIFFALYTVNWEGGSSRSYSVKPSKRVFFFLVFYFILLLIHFISADLPTSFYDPRKYMQNKKQGPRQMNMGKVSYIGGFKKRKEERDTESVYVPSCVCFA